MRIAVQDANVFIDLELADLFDAWFQTGIETHTTTFIREELEAGKHTIALAQFRNGKVHAHDLDFEGMIAVSTMVDELGSRAGFNDCSVLYLAMKLKASMISGDLALRKAGHERHVEVRGTLWIFDELVSRGIIPSVIAAEKLERLRKLDRRFPETECQSRLKKWRSIK